MKIFKQIKILFILPLLGIIQAFVIQHLAENDFAIINMYLVAYGKMTVQPTVIKTIAYTTFFLNIIAVFCYDNKKQSKIVQLTLLIVQFVILKLLIYYYWLGVVNALNLQLGFGFLMLNSILIFTCLSDMIDKVFDIIIVIIFKIAILLWVIVVDIVGKEVIKRLRLEWRHLSNKLINLVRRYK